VDAGLLKGKSWGQLAGRYNKVRGGCRVDGSLEVEEMWAIWVAASKVPKGGLETMTDKELDG